ncbi:MAG: metal-dependent hydrolase [Psychrilyobacter sp.]|nr:metal-dependent hydrolase [Psychrilyobacter sp.]
MIALTHITFAVATSLMLGATSTTTITLVGIGSLLPDIDYPKSTLGKLFLPISIYLNKKVGHRTLTHSLLVWVPLNLIGLYFYKPLFFITMGAISHLVLDSWNVSGVMLFNPFSEKLFVLAGRNYRIRSGSRPELILITIFLFMSLVMGHINTLGGARTIIQTTMASYNMAYENYSNQGLHISYIQGKLRFPNGYTKSGKWLVIGKNSRYMQLTILDEKRNKLIKIYEDAEFLKAVLLPTREKWQTLELSVPMELKSGNLFFRPGKSWRKAKPGDTVIGYLIHKVPIELEEFKRSYDY